MGEHLEQPRTNLLISTLKPVDNGYSTRRLPLHISVAPWFYVPEDQRSALLNALQNRMHGVVPVKTIGEQEAFDYDGHTRVRMLGGTGIWHDIHQPVMDILDRHEAQFDASNTHTDYRPYVSYVGRQGLEKGQEVTVSRLQLVTRVYKPLRQHDFKPGKTVERGFQLQGKRR